MGEGGGCGDHYGSIMGPMGPLPKSQSLFRGEAGGEEPERAGDAAPSPASPQTVQGKSWALWVVRVPLGTHQDWDE